MSASNYPDARQNRPEPKGLSLDGGRVNLRGEGWKEFKTGVVYDVEPRPVLDTTLDDPVELVQRTHLAYCAVVGSVSQFAPTFWELAVCHAIPKRRIPASPPTGLNGIGLWSLTFFLIVFRLWIGFTPRNTWH